MHEWKTQTLKVDIHRSQEVLSQEFPLEGLQLQQIDLVFHKKQHICWKLPLPLPHLQR